MHIPQNIERWPVARLQPYAGNARTHDAAQVAQIAASIVEFGFTNPILVDGADGIIAGHGRLMAAQHLGLTEVPVIVLGHLTDAQRRAYILAYNRLALSAGWSEEILAAELAALQADGFDLELTGFTDDELADLLDDGEGGDSDGYGDPDEAPEPPTQPATVLGDVWLLGKHRLMCGDSTSIAAVGQLLDGNTVDMVFTDPPYNVAFNGRSGKHDVIKNDDMETGAFDDFIGEVLRTIKAVNPPIYYIWCNWKFYATLQRELEYKSCIVWAKNVFGLGTNYRHQHEFCLFNGSIDAEIKNESDLWHVKKDTSYVHPTQKPVELSQRALGNHKAAANILDLFGGSGSTLMGCETMKRRAFVMELDPKYCDVIVRRWQDLTGKQAVLAATGETFESVAAGRLAANDNHPET